MRGAGTGQYGPPPALIALCLAAAVVIIVALVRAPLVGLCVIEALTTEDEPQLAAADAACRRVD